MVGRSMGRMRRCALCRDLYMGIISLNWMRMQINIYMGVYSGLACWLMQLSVNSTNSQNSVTSIIQTLPSSIMLKISFKQHRDQWCDPKLLLPSVQTTENNFMRLQRVRQTYLFVCKVKLPGNQSNIATCHCTMRIGLQCATILHFVQIGLLSK